MKLRGAQKIAAALLGLENETAALLLKSMPPRTLEIISEAMVDLSANKFNRNDAEPALQEFLARVDHGDGVVNDFKELFNSALGEELARPHLERFSSSQEQGRPFAGLELLPPDEVADVLLDENEQVCAMVLAAMKPRAAAQVFENFPAEVRPKILKRIACGSTLAPELALAASSSLLRRLAPERRTEPKGSPGLEAAASILNFLEDTSEEEIATALEEQDQELYQAIDEHRVTMDDLASIDKRSMQKVLAGIDTDVLTVALKGVSDEVEAAVLASVSKRSRDNIMEERELLGPKTATEVHNAQQELLQVVRAHVKSGAVVLIRGGEDLVD